MSKGIHRFIALLGLFTALSLIVVACGGDEDEATATPQRPAATAPPAATQPPAPTATRPPAPTATPVPTNTPVPPTATPANQPRLGGTLRWTISADVTTLDPQKSQSGTDWSILFTVGTWLVKWGAVTGVQTDLADSWTTSQDGTTVTFNLNKAATWHDGKKITADDIIFNLNRILKSDDLRTGNAPCRGLLADVRTYDKVDDNTLRVTLAKVSPTFLPTLGVHCSIMNPPQFPVADFQKRTAETVKGGGAYTFKDYTQGVKVSLVKNPNFWKKDAQGRTLPYMDAVDFFRVPDITFEYNLLRTGQIDALTPFGGDRLAGRTQESVKRDIPDAITQSSSLHSVYVTFRSDTAPWNDVRVRKALSLALDREAFSLAYTQGQGPPLRGFAYPGTPWATPESELRTWPGYNPATKRADVEEAKRLLKEAGVDLSSIKLAIPIYQGAEKSAEVFVSLWGSSLGTAWTVNMQDVATFRQTGLDRNFGIYGNLQSSAFTDPSATVEPWYRSTGPSNTGKFVDATVDAQLDEMNRTVDENRRVQIVRQLEKEILVNKVWYIIGTNGLKNHAWRGWLKGYNGYQFASEAASNVPERWWLER